MVTNVIAKLEDIIQGVRADSEIRNGKSLQLRGTGTKELHMPGSSTGPITSYQLLGQAGLSSQLANKSVARLKKKLCDMDDEGRAQI